MNQPDEPALNEELYRMLERLNTRAQAALVDERYGFDKEFTEQTKSLLEKIENSRDALRESASRILSADSDDFKKIIEKLGVRSDQIDGMIEAGDMASKIGTAIERIVKIAHPLL